jgi:NADPH2:quinone reductase
MGSFLGSFATHIVVPIAAIQTLPPGWDLISAAGVSSTLPVSHGALLRARIQPGETVLVHAAAGGLGLMAVQLAKALGCTVIGTASTRDKRAVASRYGCDHVVDYTVTGWDKEVMQLTGGKGADIVYDPVGLISESVRCTAHFGRILIIGFAGREGNMENVKMNRLLLKQIEVIGYRFGETHRRRPAETKKVWEELERLVKEGKIKPTVYDGDYRGLESIPRAMRDMADRKVWGKAVIVVDEEDAASKAKI